MKTNRREIEYLICTILKYNFFIRIKGETHKNLNRAMNAVDLFDGEWFFGAQELESHPRLEAVFLSMTANLDGILLTGMDRLEFI